MSDTLEIAPELEKYLKTVNTDREEFEDIVNWHLAAYHDGGIPLPPYGSDSKWITVSIWNYDVPRDDPTYGELNVEETTKALARIIKYARKRGFKVEKEYEGRDFEVRVSLDRGEGKRDITIAYTASRSAVCEKRVIGTKVIPAHVTPERIEEEVEWTCEKISFLEIDTD